MVTIVRPPQRRHHSSSPPMLIGLFLALALGVILWMVFRSPSSPTMANTASNATNSSTASTNASTANANVDIELTTFRNTEFGFSLQYPATWEQTTNENGTGENRIVNFLFQNASTGVTLIVLPASMEGIVRESVSVVSETTVTINGIAATRISARTAKDGSPMGLLFFQKDAMLYDLNGPLDLVDDIGSTFHFIN
ncbi:MAG: PsbP-related protein [bacterium]